MPTIGQLPALNQVDPADEIPLSHNGATQSVRVGTLLAGMQPAIQAPTGALLGRVSLGLGGPEPIEVGAGLALQGSTVAANGADHASFPIATDLLLSDQAVLSSAGAPKLLELSLLRGLFSPGANVSIDSSGTISANVPTGSGSSGGGTYSITDQSVVTTIAQGDLVGISQAGNDHTITYQNFLNGQTIDEAQPAAPVAASDAMWVAQGTSTMVRQTFSAIWAWILSNLPTYRCPVIEITSNINLDATVHNGRILVCSQPVVLTPVFVNMGSGFSCSVLNLSGGDVTLGIGIVTSSGASVLPPGQSGLLQGIVYSGGSFIFASLSSGVSAAVLAVPGAVGGLVIGGFLSDSVTLSWSAPTSGGPVSDYAVQYRLSGSTSWTVANTTVAGTAYTVSGLQASTAYDFAVYGTNAAGAGPLSAVVSCTTGSATAVAPGQVTGLAATAPTTSSVTLSWAAPTVGTLPFTYIVAYRVTGNASWTTFASGITSQNTTVTGLSASTAYDFEVTAINAGGSGTPSAITQQSTSSPTNAVTSITWNLAPSGTYTAGSGSIGVNAHVNPATSPIQFGFSTSLTVPPAVWTTATFVNTDLWGAYVNTPTTAGTWYAWAEGTDGSAPTVWPTPFAVS
jgi:hypothetical protein